ncbi:MAG: hypothetical protein HYW01_08490 [Deltaproteobacteria bacterium]|nr:hypothetical protein [Deltaproteobacteria bacterium]
MKQPNKEVDFIKLSFGLDSNAGLWNVVFEGFDQEVILVSRFEGKELEAIRILYRFGAIIEKKYKDCQVEPTGSGLLIKKKLPTNDLSLIREWTELMCNIREEMTSIVIKELGA